MSRSMIDVRQECVKRKIPSKSVSPDIQSLKTHQKPALHDKDRLSYKPKEMFYSVVCGMMVLKFAKDEASKDASAPLRSSVPKRSLLTLAV